MAKKNRKKKKMTNLIGINIFEHYNMTKEESQAALRLQRKIRQAKTEAEVDNILEKEQNCLRIVMASNNKGLMEGIDATLEEKRHNLKTGGAGLIFSFSARI